MNCRKLNIGAYCLASYARSEKHIKELADCGIDLVVCVDCDRTTLDLLEKYHIGVIVSNVMPEWWGGDGSNAGTMEQGIPFMKYVEAAERFQDHPAIWGVSTGDEPSALDIPYYGKIIDYVEEAYPNQFAYLNLYPDYALNPKGTEEESRKGLRTATYEEYIEAYCRHVNTDYICFDYYMYAANIAGAYHSMQTVARACRKYNRSMWMVLQVNSFDPNVFTGENQLRFQAYLAMAFGAENIFWGCYTTGWWYNQVLDEHGEKTEQYEKLKLVNHELRTLGDTYMKYRCIDTYFVGNMSDAFGFSPEDEKQCETLDMGSFENVHTENGTLLVIGRMKHREDESIPDALMLFAADDPYDKKNQSNVVSFRSKTERVTLYTGNGSVVLKPVGEEIYQFELMSSYGVLLVC